MFQVACPNCRQRLKVPEGAQGKSATCPKCKNRFRVAGDKRASQPELTARRRADHNQNHSQQAKAAAPEVNSDRHSSIDKSSQLILVFVCLFVGNVILFLGTALASSLGFATFLLVVAILLEIAVLQRQRVFNFVGQAWNTWQESRHAAAKKQVAAVDNNIVEDVEVVQPKSNDDRRPHATPVNFESNWEWLVMVSDLSFQTPSVHPG